MHLRLFNCCDSEQNIDPNIDKINMTLQSSSAIYFLVYGKNHAAGIPYYYEEIAQCLNPWSQICIACLTICK